jgi:hypothetical protein
MVGHAEKARPEPGSPGFADPASGHPWPGPHPCPYVRVCAQLAPPEEFGAVEVGGGIAVDEAGGMVAGGVIAVDAGGGVIGVVGWVGVIAGAVDGAAAPGSALSLVPWLQAASANVEASSRLQHNRRVFMGMLLR